MGAGRAGAREPRGSPSGRGRRSRDPASLSGCGGGAVQGKAGGGGAGGGAAAPPPRSRGPPGARFRRPPVSAAPLALSVRRQVGLGHPLRGARAGLPRSGITPDWAPRWGRGDPRATALLTRTLLPGKVAPQRAAWPEAGSGGRVTILPPFGLFVRRLSAPLSLWPSPLPPLVGTAPLGQAFFLSSSSSLERARIFFSHLRGILITYFSLSFQK